MSIKNFAVVTDGVVQNVIAWDGQTAYSVEGAELVEATEDTRIGGTYDGAFHFVEPTPPEPTAEQVASAEARQGANAKLKALGLSDAEVAAIVGAA